MSVRVWVCSQSHTRSSDLPKAGVTWRGGYELLNLDPLQKQYVLLTT